MTNHALLQGQVLIAPLVLKFKWRIPYCHDGSRSTQIGGMDTPVCAYMKAAWILPYCCDRQSREKSKADYGLGIGIAD